MKLRLQIVNRIIDSYAVTKRRGNMKHFIAISVLGLLLVGCSQAPTPTAVISESTPTSKPAPPTWNRSVQRDEITGVEEDWYNISGLLTDESDYVSGPLGRLPKFPRIAVLCTNHKLKQVQFEPRLRWSLDSESYIHNAIPARLDDKEVHTFYWGLADSRDAYFINKADLRFLLKHKQAVFGVKSRGTQIPLKFTEIPEPDAQMKKDCSL